MKKEMYIVTAYRWGYTDSHSYTLGAFQDKELAIKVADSHCKYRGGKYACVVDKCILNDFNNDYDNYTVEVYRAKSLID